jgi:hypothetical protein
MMVRFPIHIQVSPNAFENIRALTVILSHEFSHVYLHSKRDPQANSEYATDICALMMGFTPFWELGRVTVSQGPSFTHTLKQRLFK